MRNLPAIAVWCAAALLSGCSSSDFGDKVRSALGPREAPKTRTFQAEQKPVYEAARAAAEAMGYRFVRGGPAEGELYALSGISSGDDTGGSRQIALRVRLGPDPVSGTDVTVAFNEIIEEDSKGMPTGSATETPLRDTPLYEVYFRSLRDALQSPRKAQ